MNVEQAICGVRIDRRNLNMHGKPAPSPASVPFCPPQTPRVLFRTSELEPSELCSALFSTLPFASEALPEDVPIKEFKIMLEQFVNYLIDKLLSVLTSYLLSMSSRPVLGPT
jgi:hypothetical protein